jgi:hypothetical protein
MIQIPLLFVVLHTALWNLMAPLIEDPLHMRARIAQSTSHAIWLRPWFSRFILWLWVSACDIGVYVNASWTILTVFMLRCNLVLVFVADDAKDLLIGTMIESLIVIGCLCYLNRDHVTS